MKSNFFNIKEDFWIKNELNENVFFVDSKLFSLGYKINILKDNEILYTVKERLLSLLLGFQIYDKNNEVVATVKERLTIWKDKMTVESKFGDFTIKGDFFNYYYKIYQGNTLVAIVEKKLLAFTDNYYVDIFHDDHAFILALVVVIDKLIDKQKD